jgi:hypothetical protein
VSSAGAGGRAARATGGGEVSVHGGGEATLVDLLDRVIGSGVVVHGDIVLGVAGVDLVHVGLRLVLRGVDEPGGVR